MKGIKVEFDEDLPSLELEIKFLSLTTTLSLDVMAGLPAKLEWIMPKNAAYDPHGHLLVMNRVPAGQWSVQVKDKFSKETKFAGLVVALGVSKRTEVKAETQKPITNSEGIASFGFVRITAKDTTPPAASTCRCRSRLLRSGSRAGENRFPGSEHHYSPDQDSPQVRSPPSHRLCRHDRRRS